jgi:predicted nucleic acid-binding protein
MIHVLDASAILRFTDREPGFDRVRNLLHAASQGSAQLVISAVNWGEIVAVLHRKDSRMADVVLGNLAVLPINIVPVDAASAEEAGRFKWEHNVPYADAFAGALTLSCSQSSSKLDQVTLVTADYDFKNVAKGTISIEFLPLK